MDFYHFDGYFVNYTIKLINKVDVPVYGKYLREAGMVWLIWFSEYIFFILKFLKKFTSENLKTPQHFNFPFLKFFIHLKMKNFISKLMDVLAQDVQ